MTAATHTPGPWEADSNGKIWGDIENPVHDGDSPLLAEMWGNGAEQRANARLIAAATDLLSTARETAEQPCSTLSYEDGEPGCCWTCRARAAVAKATHD